MRKARRAHAGTGAKVGAFVSYVLFARARSGKCVRRGYLKHLSLVGTKVDDAMVAALAPTQLVQLNLSQTLIGDAACWDLNKMSRLRKLALANNKIGAKCVERLAGHSLKTLDLSQTEMAKGLYRSMRLPKLRRFWAPRNHVSADWEPYVQQHPHLHAQGARMDWQHW